MANFPSVSAVGSRLVFQRTHRDYDIWQYRVGGEIQPLITSSLGEFSPQFSPDGSKIAFTSNRGGAAPEIWVALGDGSSPVQMTHGLGRGQGSPQWSPDGRWIAFDSQDQDGQWDIYVIDASGGRPRRFTFEGSNEVVPSWSHDGRWIYFCSNRSGRDEIWRAPSRGGAAVRLTYEGGFMASESIDGATLFYTKAESSPLFAKPLSGGPERQLLDWVFDRSFFPVQDGIYYIGRRNEMALPLKFFRFASQNNEVITNIRGPLFMGLSVSPDGATILFTKTVAFGANLMMIENFH